MSRLCVANGEEQPTPITSRYSLTVLGSPRGPRSAVVPRLDTRGQRFTGVTEQCVKERDLLSWKREPHLLSFETSSSGGGKLADSPAPPRVQRWYCYTVELNTRRDGRPLAE